VREVYEGDIALFEAPCSICGEPMVLAHDDKNWESEIKPTLLNAFKSWYYIRCEEKRLKS